MRVAHRCIPLEKRLERKGRIPREIFANIDHIVINGIGYVSLCVIFCRVPRVCARILRRVILHIFAEHGSNFMQNGAPFLFEGYVGRITFHGFYNSTTLRRKTNENVSRNFLSFLNLYIKK